MQTKLGAHTFIGVLTMLTLVLTATSVARADEERVVWGDRLNPFGLHSARSDGNDPRLLEDGTAWDPRISRDGQWIVYCTEQGVMRVQSDGNSNPELLVSVQRPYSPVLSPDGNLLAYLGTAPMLVDLRTGEQWTMDHRIFTHYLDFSPDGKWVLQVSGGLSSSDQIFVVAPQRGAPLRLLAAFGNRAAAYARFLSASEILVMVHNYDTGRFVVKIDLAGNMTSLPYLPAADRFAVSRDAQRLVTADYYSGMVRVIDFATGNVLSAFPVTGTASSAFDIGSMPTCLERCEGWTSACPYLDSPCLCQQMYRQCQRSCGLRTKVPYCPSEPFPR